MAAPPCTGQWAFKTMPRLSTNWHGEMVKRKLKSKYVVKQVHDLTPFNIKIRMHG